MTNNENEFEENGIVYVARDSGLAPDARALCLGCSFRCNGDDCSKSNKFSCISMERKDKKFVIFLEKIISEETNRLKRIED